MVLRVLQKSFWRVPVKRRVGRVESAETERSGREDGYDTAIFRIGKSVSVHVFPKFQKEVDRYWKWCYIWKSITLAALVSVVLANVLDLVGITDALTAPTYFLTFVSMAIYMEYRVKYSKK